MGIFFIDSLNLFGQRGAFSKSSALTGPASEKSQKKQGRFVPGEMLIAFREGTTEVQHRACLSRDGHGLKKRFRSHRNPGSKINRLYHVSLSQGKDVQSALEEIRNDPLVESAQPNFIYHKHAAPNDQYFYLQWAQQNIGDNLPHTDWGLQGPDPRIPDADMQSVEAFDLINLLGATLETVVVGVIDTGVDLTHPDLAEAIWGNPDEIPDNGVDDDNNGYVDDIHGWDFVYDDNDPMDLEGHGTHVAGCVGAVSNNIIGVSGTAANVRLMPLRFLDSEGSGYTSYAIDAIYYGIENGARILNSGWGGGDYDEVLLEAIQDARDSGVLFIAAAGNDMSDNDEISHYPSNYKVDNVISVGASTPWRDLAGFSNWVQNTVHLAAPGDEIISTTRATLGDGVPEAAYQIAMPTSYGPYAPWSGTSMSTPAVSGAAAIVFGLGEHLWPESWETMNPVDRMLAVRERILERTQRWPSFGGMTATEGHLNLFNLVEEDTTPPAGVGSSLEVVCSGTTFVTFRCEATGDDGTMGGRANYYDLRYQQGLTFDFDTATQAKGIWTPGEPETMDYFSLKDLMPGTEYTFGMKVVDNTGNASVLSDLVTVSTASLVAETAIFQDDMESGQNGWTSSTWTLSTASSHSPTHCWTDSVGLYPNRSTRDLISPEILAEGGPAVLTFWQRYDIETDWDFGYVQVRQYNSGLWSAWVTLSTLTGYTGEWHQINLDIPETGERVQIRFSLVTDRSVQADGWYIDDVAIYSTSAADPDLLLWEDTFEDGDSWDLAGDWDIESNTLSDSPGGDYPANNRASVTMAQPLDLSNTKAVRVSFDLVSFLYESGFDYLIFEYSQDGINWRVIDRFTGSMSGTQTHDLRYLSGMPTVYFRFRSATDYGNEYDGVCIDNFRVEVREATTNDSDGDGIYNDADNCPDTPNADQLDSDGDGIGDACDGCPTDTLKVTPGECGCGVADMDMDGDGTPDCKDLCPSDPLKVTPGICGCGISDTDTDGDGVSDCIDEDDDDDGDPDTTDCAPLDPTVFNGAPEVCDGVDNDCDGQIDNGVCQQETLLQLIDEVIVLIDEMSEDVFKMSRNKSQLLKNLLFAHGKVETGRYRIALNKLERVVLSKIDGCAQTDLPDKNDWILDCDAQGQVYPLIMGIMDQLRALIGT